MKPGDLVEYIRSEDEPHSANEPSRKFYILLYDGIFYNYDNSVMNIWWCIPLSLKYSKTWIRSETLVKIND
jgi:hypothetical protein